MYYTSLITATIGNSVTNIGGMRSQAAQPDQRHDPQ